MTKRVYSLRFAPFKRDKLAELLARHAVSAEGLAYIESALDKPSRNVAGTIFNQISDIPCPKMNWNSQAESATTENPLTIEQIFNPEILGYVNQPPSISLRYLGRNGKTVRTPYTPDTISFHWTNGISIEEWKPASARSDLEEKHPGKYQRMSDGSFRSEPVERLIHPWGFKFRIRFSDEVSVIAHANRVHLYRYLSPDSRDLYATAAAEIICGFGDRLCPSYADLIEEGGDIDALNWALANSYLHFDYNSALIERDQSDVLIFRHAESLNAWKLAIRPDGSQPKPFVQGFSPTRDLVAGDIILYDGLRLTVNLVGVTSIHAVDPLRNALTLKHEEIVAAYRAGIVELPERAHALESKSPFWKASSEALERAIRKASILEKIDAKQPIDRQDQYSDSTYRRWRKSVRDGVSKGWSPVESLIDDYAERGFHGSHIDKAFSETLDAWIKEALEDPKNPSALSIYYQLEARAKKIGQCMVAMSSYYVRVAQIRSLTSIKKSEGHKVEYALKPSYWMLEFNTPIHGTRALETVHFDSTLLDIELRSSLSGEVLGRPWLSLAICANTRRVVGMYLSFQPPSQVSSMALLADIVRRFGRIPESIVHDWGSEFKGKDWKYALTTLRIIRHVRPKSAPRFGAIIERIFGVLTSELINNSAGNTKSRKNVRRLTPQSDPTSHSGLWLIDLFLGLEDYFFDIYDKRKHPATLTPPQAGYETSFLKHGVRAYQLRRLEEILPVLMPDAVGKPRVIDPSRGLFVNYRYYGHPELTKLALAGSTVQVKPLLFDPGSVLAFLKGNWVICKSNLSERFSRCSESIRQCVYEELRIEQRLVVQSDRMSRRRLLELQESLNRKALENIKYWDEPEARELLDTVGLAEDEIKPKVSSDLSALDLRMKLVLKQLTSSPKVTL